MVNLNHPFDKQMGRLGRKGIFGHTMGLRAPKRLASTSIVLKWRELSRGIKQGRSTMVDFDS